MYYGQKQLPRHELVLLNPLPESLHIYRNISTNTKVYSCKRNYKAVSVGSITRQYGFINNRINYLSEKHSLIL